MNLAGAGRLRKVLRELPPFPLQKVALLDMGQQWRAYSVLSFIAHVGVGSVGSVGSLRRGRVERTCGEGVFLRCSPDLVLCKTLTHKGVGRPGTPLKMLLPVQAYMV